VEIRATSRLSFVSARRPVKQDATLVRHTSFDEVGETHDRWINRMVVRVYHARAMLTVVLQEEKG
jgi:hypothetical protein